MPRRPKKRRICEAPCCEVFKPVGVPMRKSEVIQLGLDEFEAIRLVDLEGLYQEEAAAKMKTSRATIGRILEEARKKLAAALVEARPLEIKGGNVDICVRPPGDCDRCSRKEECSGVENGESAESNCPDCMSDVLELCENRGAHCRRAQAK